MIKDIFIQRIRDFCNTIFINWTLTIDGIEYDFPIYKIDLLDNKTIRVSLLLNPSEGVGTITKFQLKDENGNVLIEETDNIEKPSTQPFIYAQEISIREV